MTMKSKQAKQPDILSFKEENFTDESALVIKDLIESLLIENNTVNIALSGGNSPLPIYKKLSEFDLNWNRIKFFLVDERCVAEKSEENNFRNISQSFFNTIPSDSFPIVSDELTYEQSATKYQETINQHVKHVDGIPQFQLIILGMGLDGHTASLFPNTEALNNNKDFVVLNEVPQLNSKRITMTYPLILNAKKIILLIGGEDKINVFESASITELPISKIISSIDLVFN